jgi:hypothetical protein
LLHVLAGHVDQVADLIAVGVHDDRDVGNAEFLEYG